MTNPFALAGDAIQRPENTEDKNNQLTVVRYPHDLAEAQHPHYAMFFINVRKSDLVGEQKSLSSGISMDMSAANRPNTEGKNLKLEGIVTGAFLGAGVGKAAGNAIGVPDGGASGALVGTIGGGIVGEVVTNSLGDRSQVLLKKVIALYLNGKPSASYTANWAEEELGLAGAVANSNFEWNGIGDFLSNMGSAGAAFALKLGEDVSSKQLGNIGKTFEATAAVTPNPFKAQLFKSMKFRTFSFDYVFLPKDKTEYLQVKEIISIFKRYMHPILGKGNKFIMQYPAEFSIAYYYRYAPNAELFKISNCALTDMKVEYGGTDFTTFRNISGAPTEISLKLQFTELEMLSQDRFDGEGDF